MSRYIEAEWLEEHIEVISYEGMWHTTETDEFVAVDNINSAPSVEIIRCLECKYDGTWKCPWRNTQVPRYPSANDFCSDGEREGE